MNFYKYQSHIIVCFSRKEIELLLKDSQLVEIMEAFKESGISADELLADSAKMSKMVEPFVEKFKKDGDGTEIFNATFSFAAFYREKSEICFYLKNTFNPRKAFIRSWVALKGAIDKDSMSDFIIKNQQEFLSFQLKTYHDALTTDELFEFILRQINKYGRKMGKENLIVLIQSEDADISDVDFENLQNRLLELDLGSEAHVFISYNEADQFNVTNQIYPILGTRRIPI
jgi:hypothetical protein